MPVFIPYSAAQELATLTMRSPAIGDQDGIFVIGQDLRVLLVEYFRRLGVRPQISDGLTGRVSDMFLPIGRDAFLQEMTRRYGVEWYFEGDTVYLSNQRETITRFIEIQTLNLGYIHSQIAGVGIDPDRYPLQSVKGANAVVLTGPPSYVARIEVLVESLLNARTTGSIRVVRFGRVDKIEQE